MRDDIFLQREYYRKTAARYDIAHLKNSDEHMTALSAFAGLATNFSHASFLDVGAGTGRGVAFLQAVFPESHIIGLEPVAELRAQAFAKGVSERSVIEGDALALPFKDDEFDWVIETGVLHHIKEFRKATSEMCRVARQGVLVSDTNNLGQGNKLIRTVKWVIKAAGLWPAVMLAQTGWKGYKQSEDDGVFYSFCAFDCVNILRKKFPTIHFMNTVASGPCLRHSASQVMIFAHRANQAGLTL
jgi:ubiquinone/menaquinone biosynthesis C-methylase UbiE